MEKKYVILAVDDSAANLQLLHGLLNSEYNLRLAKSGRQAIAALSKFRPDIILMDIEMPDLSGFEVMDEIRKNPELVNIPVIFVTSHVDKEYLEKAAEYGAGDYVAKPFDPNVLRSAIQNVLSR